MNLEQEEEYLEAIYKLQERRLAVTGASLGHQLHVARSQATAGLHELVDKGMVEHAHRQRELTPAGLDRAASVVRRHRLAERFLTDILGLGLHSSHEEACRLEHILTPEAEERLAVLLGHPVLCPHGNPVPGSGSPESPTSLPLSELAPLTRCTIVQILQEDSEMLRYLATLGLMPQVELTLEQCAPFRGPLLVKVGGARYALGRDVADRILVQATGGPQIGRRNGEAHDRKGAQTGE
jgi:DtxR family transcriptional regulator, Mn-dependent transcriptional regulator